MSAPPIKSRGSVQYRTDSGVTKSDLLLLDVSITDVNCQMRDLNVFLNVTFAELLNKKVEMEGACDDGAVAPDRDEYSKEDWSVSPLMHAVLTGKEQRVKDLIQAGADVHQTDTKGNTPLINAVKHSKCNVNCVKMLLDSGTDVNKESDNGIRCICVAALNGHDEVIDLLIKAGADVNYYSNYGIPVMAAARGGHFKCVDLLLKAGTDINAESWYGNEIIESIIDYSDGEDDDCNDIDSAKCIASLLEAGLVEDPTKYLLHRAISMDRYGIVELLVKLGADLTEVDFDYGTPLMRAADHGWIKAVRLFLFAGADVNYTRSFGRNALWAATKQLRINTMKVLLDGGAHINVEHSFNSLYGLVELDNMLHYHIECSNHYPGSKFDARDERLSLLLFAAGETLDGVKEDQIPECLKFREVKDTLKHICRQTIRKHLLKLDPQQHLFGRIPKLGLPSSLNSYLLYYMSLYVKPDLIFDYDDNDDDDDDASGGGVDNDEQEEEDDDDSDDDYLWWCDDDDEKRVT